MQPLGTAAILFCLAGSLLAETEPLDAYLARDSDYCVIGVGTKNGFVVRELLFGNAGWQQLRGDNGWRYPAGKRAIVYLSQSYDSIGARAARAIESDRIEVVNADDFWDFYRGNPNYSASDLQTVPSDLHGYILAVQQIAARTRAERLKHAERALQSLLTRQFVDPTAEYERTGPLVNDTISDLHADDVATLQRMVQIILTRPDGVRAWARGEFAAAIARHYFRPGFDAVRAVAFEDPPDDWSSAAAALGGLSRIGNARDLDRMKAEAEKIMAEGQYRQVRYSLFRAMGELAARCYPEGSRRRDQWRKWFERICAHPTPEEKKLDGPGMASMALHFIGNAETKALLQSLERNEPEMRGAFNWAIQNIDARLKERR